MKNFRTSIIIIVGFIAFYMYILISSPLPVAVIDRDNSGIVSIPEALASFEVETRARISDKGVCTEYYWLDDEKTIYEDCQKSAQ